MKTKKFEKKLTLNKVSIANLDGDKIHEVKDGLKKIKGGVHTQHDSCIINCDTVGIC